MPISEFWLHYWRQIIFFTVPLSNIIFLVKIRARKFFSKKFQALPRISNGPCLTFERHDRKSREGGGVLVYVSNKIDYKRREDIETGETESIWIEIKGSSHE